MEKDIYLVLTQTGSILSRLIKVYTRSEFNHISISLSEDLDPMWSFGRRQPYNPFWGGFVKEYLWKGTFYRFPTTKCAVLKLAVSEETYKAIQTILEEMYETKDSYGYNLWGLFLASMNVHRPVHKKYYCSEFVRALFLKAGVEGAEKIPVIVEPVYFFSIPGVTTVYRGLLKNYQVKNK